MSKLTVEDFIANSESRPLTVHSTLEEGKRVNFIRCYEKKNPVDSERKAVIRNCDKFKPLWKLSILTKGSIQNASTRKVLYLTD